MNNKTLFSFILLLVACKSYVIGSAQPTLPLFSNEQLTEIQALMNENSSNITHSEFNESSSLGEPYTCTQRHITVVKSGTLTTHIRTHTGEKLFTCTQCGKSFSRNSILINHIRTHTGEKPFTCTQCGKSFAQKNNLITHTRLHQIKKHPIETETLPCTDKNGNFLTTTAIQDNNPPPSTKTSSSLIFACTQCDAVYIRQDHLIAHMYHHTGKKPFKCTMCHKSFTRSGYLTVHMKHHTGEKNYKCTVCNKSFTQKSTLSTHMNIHTAKKSLSCIFCNALFTQKGNLKTHLMRMHPNKNNDSSALASNQNSVVIIPPINHNIDEELYPCIICDRSFTQEGLLTVHMRQHETIRPYVCKYCNKSFIQMSSLLSHEITWHTNNPLYRKTLQKQPLMSTTEDCNDSMHTIENEQQPMITDNPCLENISQEMENTPTHFMEKSTLIPDKDTQKNHPHSLLYTHLLQLLETDTLTHDKSIV